MAIREIRMLGDSVLKKKAREVTEITPRIKELVQDMFETMYEQYGAGLAAPQVGILKRIVVIDIDSNPTTFINPVIEETSGEQVGDEGCLSLPGKSGTVARPSYVKVSAYDLHMKKFTVEAEGMMARAVCHELDHLDGIMYVEHVIGELRDVEEE